MINTLIEEYLADHKRLVIPSFGAFVRKEGEGIVVFMEFLKKDDGVLAGLLAAKMSADTAAALEAIDRYVVSVKTAVERTGGFLIPGVGTLYVNGDGFYALDCKRRVAAAPALHAPKPEAATVAPQPLHEPVAAKAPAAQPMPRVSVPPQQVPDQKRSAVQVASPAAASSASGSAVHASAPVVPPASAAGSAESTRLRNETSSQEFGKRTPAVPVVEAPVSKQESRGTLDAIIDSQNSRSAGRATDNKNEIKGLKYAGGGAKPVGRPRRGGKVDKVMIVAVLAALVAIAAMVYGVMSDPGPEFMLGEQTVEPAAPTAAE